MNSILLMHSAFLSQMHAGRLSSVLLSLQYFQGPFLSALLNWIEILSEKMSMITFFHLYLSSSTEDDSAYFQFWHNATIFSPLAVFCKILGLGKTFLCSIHVFLIKLYWWNAFCHNGIEGIIKVYCQAFNSSHLKMKCPSKYFFHMPLWCFIAIQAFCIPPWLF